MPCIGLHCPPGCIGRQDAASYVHMLLNAWPSGKQYVVCLANEMGNQAIAMEIVQQLQLLQHSAVLVLLEGMPASRFLPFDVGVASIEADMGLDTSSGAVSKPEELTIAQWTSELGDIAGDLKQLSKYAVRNIPGCVVVSPKLQEQYHSLQAHADADGELPVNCTDATGADKDPDGENIHFVGTTGHTATQPSLVPGEDDISISKEDGMDEEVVQPPPAVQTPSAAPRKIKRKISLQETLSAACMNQGQEDLQHLFAAEE